MSSNEDIPPAISVVIPCYNDGKYLQETIESVEQFPDSRIYEIIVIDDGSTDAFTLKKFEEINQKGYKVLKPGRVGKCKARNVGIKEAVGKYILALDADNKIEWDYIRKGLYILNSYPDIGVVYGNHHRFGDEERYVRVMGFDIRLMLVKNYIDTCAIFRKTAWESVGGFDEDMTDWEDWNLWLDMYRKGWQFHNIDEPMFHYRIRENSEGKKANLPANKERAQKYMCAKYNDLYRKEIFDMYEELKQVHQSKAIIMREKLKLPLKYLKLIFPGKAKKGDV
jgi:glycosyltransferase involved in cell wall biosynthesis